MSRRLDVLNIGDPEQRPQPVMPSACETGGCGGGPEPMIPPPPAYGDVIVNGIEITPEDIAAEIQHHPAPDAETAWLEAARALAVRALLIQEGQRLEIDAEPEEDEAGREETHDDALVRAVLEQQVRPSNAGEEECRRYYDAHQERFRTPDLFEAAHILIEPESDSEEDWSLAEQQARRIAAEVGDDAGKFAAAARTHSKCASAQQDGSLGGHIPNARPPSRTVHWGRSGAASWSLRSSRDWRIWSRGRPVGTRCARASAGMCCASIAGWKGGR